MGGNEEEYGEGKRKPRRWKINEEGEIDRRGKERVGNGEIGENGRTEEGEKKGELKMYGRKKKST